MTQIPSAGSPAAERRAEAPQLSTPIARQAAERNGSRGDETLAQGLGWFSIGLGVAEIVAPGAVARAVGLGPAQRRWLPVLGVREVLTGLGILNQTRPASWLWMRVAGDAVDLAVLGSGLVTRGSQPQRILPAMAAVAGVTAADVYNAQQLSTRTPRRGTLEFEEQILINRSPEEVYNFWRDLTNLPRFMQHLEQVTKLDENRSHWVAHGPAGLQIEWDAEITEDQPHERIAWRALPDSQVETTGAVRFERGPHGRGTRLRVNLHFNPPLGAVGAAVARMLGEHPEQQIAQDLHRLKQILETGEIATIEGQTSCRQPRVNF